MPFPNIGTSATVVAFYGAILSTITASVQLAHFLRDRVRVRVTVHRNRVIVGDPRRDPKELLIEVTATNVGRRPVTITTMGALRLYPHQTHYVFPDIIPQLPCELTEGKYVQTLLPQKGFDFENISSWEAYSTTGKIFRLNQAPWYKRWPSDFKRRRMLKREAARNT
jgi:hypothetical protein